MKIHVKHWHGLSAVMLIYRIGMQKDKFEGIEGRKALIPSHLAIASVSLVAGPRSTATHTHGDKDGFTIEPLLARALSARFMALEDLLHSIPT